MPGICCGRICLPCPPDPARVRICFWFRVAAGHSWRSIWPIFISHYISRPGFIPNVSVFESLSLIYSWGMLSPIFPSILLLLFRPIFLYCALRYLHRFLEGFTVVSPSHIFVLARAVFYSPSVPVSQILNCLFPCCHAPYALSFLYFFGRLHTFVSLVLKSLSLGH